MGALEKEKTKHFPRPCSSQGIINHLSSIITRYHPFMSHHHQVSSILSLIPCSIPGWWFLKNFYLFLPPKLGKIFQFDEHIFQMGSFNHQLDPLDPTKLLQKPAMTPWRPLCASVVGWFEVEAMQRWRRGRVGGGVADWHVRCSYMVHSSRLTYPRNFQQDPLNGPLNLSI